MTTKVKPKKPLTPEQREKRAEREKQKKRTALMRKLKDRERKQTERVLIIALRDAAPKLHVFRQDGESQRDFDKRLLALYKEHKHAKGGDNTAVAQ